MPKPKAGSPSSVAAGKTEGEISHDKILRTLARHFLKDLVEIFFPDVAGDVDFA